MYGPWRVRAYERTCPAGHTWPVPAWAAHPHARGLPFGPPASDPRLTRVSLDRAILLRRAGRRLAEPRGA
jgi:hypothetical protein